MSRHTPGPWSLRESYDRGEPSGYVVSGEYENTADVILGSFGDKETEANAYLIAAAPEMYEALRAVHAAAAGFCDGICPPPDSWEGFMEIVRDETRKALDKANEHYYNKV